jgi:hypothetical protein
LARQKHAVSALIKLQSYGVTDDEILNIYEFMNRARLENAVRISHSSIGSLLLKSNGQNDSDFGKYNIVGSRFK